MTRTDRVELGLVAALAVAVLAAAVVMGLWRQGVAAVAVLAVASIQARASAQASGASRPVPGACGAARTTRPDVEPSAGRRSAGERIERMDRPVRVRAPHHPHDSKRPPATPSTRAGGHPTDGERTCD